MPVYIGKRGDLVECYRCLTNSQSENSATQLVSSIKHKLSHAILLTRKMTKEIGILQFFFDLVVYSLHPGLHPGLHPDLPDY